MNKTNDRAADYLTGISFVQSAALITCGDAVGVKALIWIALVMTIATLCVWIWLE